MWIAQEAAETFLSRYSLRRPIAEDEVDRAAAEMGVRFVSFWSSVPVREFRKGRVIGLRDDLNCSWRLWLKVHGLAHFQLHRGDQSRGCDLLGRQETQADSFTGFVLIGAAILGSGLAPHEIADWAGVPLDCVIRWLALVLGG